MQLPLPDEGGHPLNALAQVLFQTILWGIGGGNLLRNVPSIHQHHRLGVVQVTLAVLGGDFSRFAR